MIPFNPYIKPPTWYANQTHTIGGNNEASLYDSVFSEFIWLYGSDVVWLNKDVRKQENIFGDYLAAVIDKGYPMRMFIEEMEAWGGSGDIYSKFGLQVTDECTLFINKTSFFNASNGYPKPGDLVYITKAQKLFEVQHIEDESAPGFYLFGNRTGYKISCKMFSYSHETIDQSVGNNIPDAVKALDELMDDTQTATQVTLQQKEVNNFVKPIQKHGVSIIDDSETDALG